MRQNANPKAYHLCISVFTLCLFARCIEYFLIQTDKTAVGENVFHKIAGILLLAVVLKRTHLTWNDIRFQKRSFIKCIGKGLLLGIVCFTVSYGAELAISAVQGSPAHLEIYISSFSLTGSQIKNTDFVFFALCIFFNIINVWMEEGVFRGLFLKTLSKEMPFTKSNLISAFLFGIWHIVMPIRSCITGEMSFPRMIFMSIGYIILSGIMGIKWGLLYHMTGNIWTGVGDHLFNNTVATNILHVVSLNGADELQIVRIMAAQILSFAFVLVIYYDKSRNTTRRP